MIQDVRIFDEILKIGMHLLQLHYIHSLKGK